jgi:hypothetical protein
MFYVLLSSDLTVFYRARLNIGFYPLFTFFSLHREPANPIRYYRQEGRNPSKEDSGWAYRRGVIGASPV